MKKLIFLLLLATFAMPAFAQRGASIGQYSGPKDANGCPTPDVNYLHTCIYETSEIKVSSYGKPYQDPVNMMTAGFSLSFAPIVVGAPGSLPKWTNKGTVAAPVWELTIPAAPAPIPVNFTSFNCTSFSGVPSIGANGVWTFAQAAGAGCNFK